MVREEAEGGAEEAEEEEDEAEEGAEEADKEIEETEEADGERIDTLNKGKPVCGFCRRQHRDWAIAI